MHKLWSRCRCREADLSRAQYHPRVRVRCLPDRVPPTLLVVSSNATLSPPVHHASYCLFLRCGGTNLPGVGLRRVSAGLSVLAVPSELIGRALSEEASLAPCWPLKPPKKRGEGPSAGEPSRPAISCLAPGRHLAVGSADVSTREPVPAAFSCRPRFAGGPSAAERRAGGTYPVDFLGIWTSSVTISVLGADGGAAPLLCCAFFASSRSRHVGLLPARARRGGPEET